ncbi:hypothetical protein BJX76DRAFT_356179 [Aspergillus varians]
MKGTIKIVSMLSALALAQAQQLDKPALTSDLDYLLPGNANSLPTASGYIPKDCQDLGEGEDLNVTDFEVYQVQYDDCSDPWLFCRHKDVEVDIFTAAETFSKLPVRVRDWVRQILLLPGATSAFAINGNVAFFGTTGENVNVMIHQAAHGLDGFAAFGENWSDSEGFLAAYDADTHVPDNYARSSQAESVVQNTVVAVYDSNVPEIVAWQLQAQVDPPADFGFLDGSFEPPDASRRPSHLQCVVGTYTDACGIDSTTVILEEHTFDLFDLATTTSDTWAAFRKTLIRKLAWMLKEGDESATNSPETPAAATEKQSPVSLLPCLGYLPIAADGHPSLIYSLPPSTTGSSTWTLHDYVLNSPRPTLGDRFTMTLSLAETTLNIHSSGWVHKDTPVPWHSRYAHIGNDAAVPGSRPSNDIYSVGILLLEIALWTTILKQFAGPIAKPQEKRALPPVQMVTDALSKSSRNPRVTQEMGEEYARLVRRCLETDFEVEEHGDQGSGLLDQFLALVIDRLRIGVNM